MRGWFFRKSFRRPSGDWASRGHFGQIGHSPESGEWDMGDGRGSLGRCPQPLVFNEVVADVRLGKFNGILTWAADRLSRNAGDLGKLVDLMDEKLLLEIRTYGQKFTNSPNEKFMLMILGSHAKLENDNRATNVRRGLLAYPL